MAASNSSRFCATSLDAEGVVAVFAPDWSLLLLQPVSASAPAAMIIKWNFVFMFYMIPRRVSGRSANPRKPSDAAAPENQRDEKHDQKKDEQDFGDADRRSRQPGETEQGCDQREYQKCE